MSNRYLLTCRCGETVPVEPKHAGSQVECSCGVKLDVPSLLELRKLPRENVVEKRPHSAWGLPQALTLAGGLILGASLVLAAGVNYARPSRFMNRIETPEQFAKNVEKAPLYVTWQIANKMKKSGLDERTALPEIVDREIDKAYSAYNIGIGALGAIGALTLAGGVLLVIKRSSVPRAGRR